MIRVLLTLCALLLSVPALAQPGPVGGPAGRQFPRPGPAWYVVGGAAPAAGIALVASTQIAGALNGGTSPTINTTGATLLVAICTSNNSGAPFPLTPTDLEGNTWTPLTPQSSANQAASQIFYATNVITGAADTVSVSGSSIDAMCSVAAFSGIATSSPLDVQNGATGSGTTQQPGSVTPSLSSSLIVTGLAAANAGSATMTINDGFSVIYQAPQVSGQNFQGAGAYLIQSGDAAVNPTWTSSAGTAASAATIAVFKP